MVAGDPPHAGEVGGCGGEGEAEMGEGFAHVAGKDEGVREMWAEESPCISVSSIREMEVGDGVEGGHCGIAVMRTRVKKLGLVSAGHRCNNWQHPDQLNSKDFLEERMEIVVG